MKKLKNFEQMIRLRDDIAQRRDEAKLCVEKLFQVEMDELFAMWETLKTNCKHENEKTEISIYGGKRTLCPDCGRESFMGYGLKSYNMMEKMSAPYEAAMKKFLKRHGALKEG